MKSILVHVLDDVGLEARLQVALDVTRGFDGHLTCLSNIPYNYYYGIDPFGGTYVSTGLFEALQTRETELRKRVEGHLAKEDVRWSYASTTNFEDKELISQGSLNDLIVMSHSVAKDGSDTVSLVGHVLTSSHTPLLLVPEGQKGFDVNHPALIAWNGSFEAGNALRAAVPMLKYSESVTIMTIDDEPEAIFPSTAASEYLSRHGVPSELRSQAAHDTSVEDVLLRTAREIGAGYIVMGAFGHSRAREYWFGGVTRTMLLNASLPLFLAR